ncbi:similar to Saccharomyces cerevisiae YML001W YPT7 Rab family GTPase [Geotrichum candidum]|uniref:Similar to Saccharomyces cerevisiae YML001W YPT7 Rab family GTPase n=1 Tax=Geotrichum candidum TaxID=1173061 RepID=A0A0J9XI80_GEOCN|nr:similar to Saccharomyces cerevisiae YML001W YPT7 Rab family GTPase [Geotrichum candidum]
MSSNARTAKVLLLGDASVGKTSLRSQFIHHIFSSAYRATVGCDFLTSKVVTTNGASTVSLQIWDTAGQERFNSIGLSFYRGTDVAVLVYDITNAASFSHLTKWLADFRENAQVRRPTILLVGNKVDKEEYRAVSTRQALEFATNNWGGQSEIAALGGTSMSVEDTCFEVSAKENIAVGAIFKKIADIVVYQAENTRELLDFDIDGRVDIEQPAVGASSRCC